MSLHGSPRSSRRHLATMAALGGTFTVYGLDTPGYGDPAPLGPEAVTIPDFASALAQRLAAPLAAGLAGARRLDRPDDLAATARLVARTGERR
ncbi:hypothetical protein ACFOON_00320 [Novosphingobium piscinae]|uniref:Alpha/beta hydrolase n=1 Tax=Novosphingobium piscinae TaxID=1507448 RepID=A0A7X1KQK5_9SPHN|nr:hypothetical protein [Novosphingobium piscinae]MBC2669837.1 hypothetical protein [Novosphingobium piscinae]